MDTILYVLVLQNFKETTEPWTCEYEHVHVCYDTLHMYSMNTTAIKSLIWTITRDSLYAK